MFGLKVHSISSFGQYLAACLIDEYNNPLSVFFDVFENVSI